MKADLSKTLCDRAFEFFQKEFTRDEHGSKLDFQTVEEDRINQMFVLVY